MADNAEWQSMLQLLDETADRYNVPRALARAVVKQESNWDMHAVGDGGRAKGWFQLHPGAAKDAGIDPARRHEPTLNIEGGIKYLRLKLDQAKGHIPTALSLYNRGTPDYRGIGDPNYIQNVYRHLKPDERPREQEKPGLLARAWNAIGPRSADAAEKPTPKWYDFVPDKPPTAGTAQPSQATPAPAATGSSGKWYDFVPEKPPEAPTMPPAPATLPTQPPAEGVAPVPQGGAPEPSPGQLPPREDAGPTDLTIDIEKSSEPPPAAPVPPTHAQQMAERPWWQKMWGTPSDPNAPDMVPPSTTFSPGYVEPGLEEQNPAREWAATGIELGSGILATTAAIPGGPLAMWPAGAAGQSYGRRLNVELGLRDAEEPIATLAPGLRLYPSDVLNLTLGFLTEAAPIAKQLLGKTQAGKAILAAETETKTAFDAWHKANQAALEAGRTGRTQAYTDAMREVANTRAVYEMKAQARNDIIAANKAEYTAAEQQWKQQGRRQILREEGDLKLWEKQAADARTREYGAARTQAEATQEGYQGQVAAREQQIRDQTRQDALTGRREQARAASEQDLYQREVAERQAADVAKAQEVQAAAEGKFAGRQADIQTAQQGQQQAIREAQQLPYTIKTGDKPAWQLYDDWRAGAKDVQVSPAQGKAALQELRNERPLTMAGTREPFSPSVEEIVKDIEQAGDTASIESIYANVKKLGKLSRSKEAVVRREAAQVGEILGDMLEQSPANNAQLGAARRAWRREAAQDTMQGWMGEKGVVATDRSGRKVINPGALKEKFEREMTKPLFAKSFTPSETQAFADFYESLAQRTPLMPSVQATRAPMPAVKPPTPSAIPQPPPPRGLTAPTPPPAEIPAPTPETLPGGLADTPPGVGAPPQTKALPARPTLDAPPAEVPAPRIELLPGGAGEGRGVPPLPPKPAEVPQTTPVRGKTATGEPIPGETAAQYTQRVADFHKARLGERPTFWAPMRQVAAAGGIGFALQRMGVPPGTADLALYTIAAGITAKTLSKHANYFLSKALLNPKYHDLMQSALHGNTIDPLFYNAMLAAMTPEEARDMPKELREQYKKVRR